MKLSEGAPPVSHIGPHSECETKRGSVFSESEGEVAQSCPTLCHPVDCSPPGSSVRGILQARILQCVAISYSRASSQPRDQLIREKRPSDTGTEQGVLKEKSPGEEVWVSQPRKELWAPSDLGEPCAPRAFMGGAVI